MVSNLWWFPCTVLITPGHGCLNTCLKAEEGDQHTWTTQIYWSRSFKRDESINNNNNLTRYPSLGPSSSSPDSFKMAGTTPKNGNVCRTEKDKRSTSSLWRIYLSWQSWRVIWAWFQFHPISEDKVGIRKQWHCFFSIFFLFNLFKFCLIPFKDHLSLWHSETALCMNSAL